MRLVMVAALLSVGCKSLYGHWEPISDDMLVACPDCDGGQPGGDMGADMAQPTCTSSSTCSVAMPVCNTSAGACVACSSGDGGMSSVECTMYHQATPFCGPSGGCVECLSKDDCASTNRACKANACASCTQNSDCTSTVCKGDGKCAAQSEIYYVDSRDAGSIAGCQFNHNSADGNSWATAFCDINDALGAPTKRPFILVKGSTTAYGALSFTTTPATPMSTVTIIGPGRVTKPAVIMAALGAAPAVSLAPSSGQAVTLVIDGMTLNGTSGFGIDRAGLSCSGSSGTATVTLKNSAIQDSGLAGADLSSCTATLDANMITGNKAGGISIAGSTTYTITNNIVAQNGNSSGKPGVTISADGTVVFAFNTVYSNGNLNNASEGGVVGPSTGTGPQIIDSIVFGNSANPKGTGTQFAGKYTLTSTVVGATDTTADPGAIKKNPTLTSTFRLDPTDTACIDQIAIDPGTKNSDHDVDGNARPKGAGRDIGASEVK